MFNPAITLIIIAKWKKKYLSQTCLAESVVGGMFCIDRYYSLPSIYFRAGLTIIRVKVKGEPKELVGFCLLLLLIRMVNKGSRKLDLLDSIQQGLTSDPPTFQRSCILCKPLCQRVFEQAVQGLTLSLPLREEQRLFLQNVSLSSTCFVITALMLDSI